MLQAERDLRTGFRESRRARYLRRKYLQIETVAVVRKTRDIAADDGIVAKVGTCREAIQRVIVPMQLHAHAVHQRIAFETIELRTHVIDAEVGIGDDSVRPAVLIRGPLHPGRLVLEAVVGPVGLHIDRSRHARTGEIAEIFLDGVVAPDRFIRTKDARLHRTRQPGQIGLPPDMVVGIDNIAHAALLSPSERICETTARLDPPSRRSSTKRSIAIKASVCGLKPGPVASGVSQLRRQERRDNLATASRKAETSPRSNPSEITTTAAPRA